MDLSKGSPVTVPAIAPERFYIVGVGSIPHSPATFIRTHFPLDTEKCANSNKIGNEFQKGIFM